MFAAGAMLAVADSELGPEVVSVASVSGGGIANVFSFASLRDPEAMRASAELVAGIARSDAIDVQAALRRARALVTVMSLAILSQSINWAAFFGLDEDALATLFPEPLVEPVYGMFSSHGFAIPIWYMIATWVVTIGTTFSVVSRRGLQQLVDALFHHGLEELQSDAADVSEIEDAISHFESEGLPMNTLSTSATVPVFCVTSLRTHAHLYIGPTRVVGGSPARTHDEPSIQVSDAVAASAAFPGVFRPVRVTGDALGLGSPREIEFLADGGVADNLGTAYSLVVGGTDSELHRLLGDPNILLVVDASKPPPVDAAEPWYLRLLPPRIRYFVPSVVSTPYHSNLEARRNRIDTSLAAGETYRGARIALPDAEEMAPVRTTLDALRTSDVADLMFEGYRRSAHAIWQLGFELPVAATRYEIQRISEEADPAEIRKIALDYPRHSRSPIALRIRREWRRLIGVPILMTIPMVFWSWPRLAESTERVLDVFRAFRDLPGW